jgi:hypothetical protein
LTESVGHDFGEQAKAFSSYARAAQAETDGAFPLRAVFDLEARIWELINAISFEGPFSDAKLMALGWSAVVVRQSHLVFANYSTELQEALTANVRTAFEHAVYVCLVSSEGFDASVLERLDHRPINSWISIASAGLEEDDDPALDFIRNFPKDMLPNRQREDDWVANFEKVCAKFEESEELYTSYRVLSSLVHPNFLTAAPYIEPITMEMASGTEMVPTMQPGTMLLSLSLGSIAWTLSALDVVIGTDFFSDLLSELDEYVEGSTRLHYKVDAAGYEVE